MKAIKDFALLFCLGLALLFVASYAFPAFSKGATLTTHAAPASAHGAAPSTSASDSIMRPPSISAQFIDALLCKYSSPACGKGQALYTIGSQYGVDPAYALAFFWHESGLGTRGEARATLSLGNLRCIDGAACIDRDRGGYAAFPTWEAGFKAWYALIAGPLYVGDGRATVAAIIPRYAPNADHNNEQAYIDAVTSAVALWRSGAVVLP